MTTSPSRSSRRSWRPGCGPCCGGSHGTTHHLCCASARSRSTARGWRFGSRSELVSLTPTEYRLLLELAEHSGAVLSRERLLEEVWGYVWAGDTRLVDMHVRRLRAKIGPETIETVRGAGYKLVRG